MSGYSYYSDADAAGHAHRNAEAALRLSRERANPATKDPDYLILKGRSRLLRQWIEELDGDKLDILDVGGRLQPYRDLLERRSRSYIAVDRQFEGLADIVATAERLPFPDESFHVVLCAQVLSYVDDPRLAVEAMYRVLRPGGHLFLSVPSFCPQYHDERWRFLRDGVALLLSDFSDVQICPEVSSFAGGLRTTNKIVNQTRSRIGKSVASRMVFPVLNRLGLIMGRRPDASEFLAPNYSAWAKK